MTCKIVKLDDRLFVVANSPNLRPGALTVASLTGWHGVFVRVGHYVGCGEHDDHTYSVEEVVPVEHIATRLHGEIHPRTATFTRSPTGEWVFRGHWSHQEGDLVRVLRRQRRDTLGVLGPALQRGYGVHVFGVTRTYERIDSLQEALSDLNRLADERHRAQVRASLRVLPGGLSEQVA